VHRRVVPLLVAALASITPDPKWYLPRRGTFVVTAGGSVAPQGEGRRASTAAMPVLVDGESRKSLSASTSSKCARA
jgi:hypothetical protein